jgi:hypothetical protein
MQLSMLSPNQSGNGYPMQLYRQNAKNKTTKAQKKYHMASKMADIFPSHSLVAPASVRQKFQTESGEKFNDYQETLQQCNSNEELPQAIRSRSPFLPPEKKHKTPNNR